MKIDKWIDLKPFQLQSRNEEMHAAYMSSPYDVPKSLVISKDEVHDLLEIVFVYIGEDEDTEVQYNNAGVKIEVGTNSRRLKSISLCRSTERGEDIPSTDKALLHKVDTLMDAVDRFIQIGIDSHVAEKRSIDNYRIAKQALQSTKDKLSLSAA